MITLKYKFTYHFYEEKNKFISDETLTIKGRLLYLSAILLFLSNKNEFQITSIFGVKFGTNQNIEMSYVIYFLIAAVFYNLLSFLHKYHEDKISQIKIKKSYTNQEKSDAALKNEIIKDQIIEFKKIDSYKPIALHEYKEVLDGFLRDVEYKIKAYLLEKDQEAVNPGLTQSDHEILSTLDGKTREIVKKYISRFLIEDKYNKTLDAIEKNLLDTLESIKSDSLKQLDCCLDPEIFKEDIKATQDKFQISFDELTKALNKRSVKVKTKAFINFWIPILFTFTSLVWTFYKILDFDYIYRNLSSVSTYLS